MPPRQKALVGPPRSAVPASNRLARYYNEPIGPPSEPVSLAPGWVGEAREALARVEHELDRITGGNLAVEGGEPDLGRCDVSDLAGQVSKWYDNSYYRQELKKWSEHRLFASAFATRPGPQKKQHDSQDDEGREEQARDGEGSARQSKKRKTATGATGSGRGKGKEKEKEKEADLPEEEGADEEDAEEDGLILDREVRQLTRDAQEKSLGILKPWDAEYYLRKTKTADSNCLSEIRPTFAPAPDLTATPLNASADPLSDILLTITFHPISRIVRRINTSPQQQTFVCLGSNTLGDLRDNLTAGGDGIPREAEPDEERATADENTGNDGHEGEEDDSDEDGGGNEQYGIGEMDEMGTIESATRKRISGTFGNRQDGRADQSNSHGKRARRYDSNGREIYGWVGEHRVTGACFGIDGVFYPDLNGEGKTDYAKMLLELIDKTQWSDKNGKRLSEKRGNRLLRIRTERDGDTSGEEHDDSESSAGPDSPSSPASPFNPRSNDISVHSTPAPGDFDDIDPVLRNGYNGGDITMADAADEIEQEAKDREHADPHKPKFVGGSPMHQTKLADLALRVGQPYWFVHQGNYEHVWTVDAIRWRHPFDPPLTAPTSTHPYPLTLALSRQLASRCHICDKDPGALVIMNDFSASENPSLACYACLDYLHPEIPSQRDIERARRKAERKEEKRLAKEERRKEIVRERRRIKRKNQPKDDDSVGSGGENELPELPELVELPVEEDSESESEEEAEEEVGEQRQRKYMDGVQVVPTVIER
ncbi:hypothetical protein JCM11491_002330 [Sporobolomyces phaffii]